MYQEIYQIDRYNYGSREIGYFIIHNGKGNFDVYNKVSGEWFQAKIKFPYSLFSRNYSNPKIEYLKIGELYQEYKYLVLCKYCETKFIVPARFDMCNECYKETSEKNFKIQNIYGKREILNQSS